MFNCKVPDCPLWKSVPHSQITPQTQLEFAFWKAVHTMKRQTWTAERQFS